MVRCWTPLSLVGALAPSLTAEGPFHAEEATTNQHIIDAITQERQARSVKEQVEERQLQEKRRAINKEHKHAEEVRAPPAAPQRPLLFPLYAATPTTTSSGSVCAANFGVKPCSCAVSNQTSTGVFLRSQVERCPDRHPVYCTPAAPRPL